MAIIPVNIENLKPNKEYIVTVRSKNNDVNVVSSYTDSVRFSTPTDSTIPNAPTNLVLSASFLNVLFSYTDSIDDDTAKYEYELYKQDQISIVDAQYVVDSGEIPHRTGYVQTNVFVVSVEDNSSTTSTSSTTSPVKYYGRVRTIDTAGNISGWTNIIASGDTPLIDEEFIGSLTAAKITAGEIGAHTITLSGGTGPGNYSIIQSSTYNPNDATPSGWYIRGDGHLNFGGSQGITYNGSSVVIGSAVNVQAELNANSITVGSGPYLRIDDDLQNGTKAGMELGNPTYNYWYTDGQFSLGNASNYVRWNGTNLSVAGSINILSGNIGNTPINSIEETVIDFNSRNNRNSTTPTAPTIASDGTAIDHTLNTDGSADISFEWNYTTSTTQNAANNIDGFYIYVYSSESSSTYTFGTTPALESTYPIDSDRRAIVLSGVAANKYYTFGIKAYRVVDRDVNTDEILYSSIVKSTGTGENPYRPSANVAFAGDVTGTIDGTAVATLVSYATAGNTVATNYNANNDRNSTTPTSPVVPSDGTAIDHVLNTDGSADISFEWTYTVSDVASNANNIDGFIVYVRSSTSSSSYTFGTTPVDETTYYVTREKRAFVLSAGAANRYYNFGVRAYRMVDTDIAASGIIYSPIIQSTGTGENPYRPSANVAFAGDVTGTIDGTAVATLVSYATAGNTVATNYNANNDRNSTTPTSPVVPSDGTAIDHVLNTDGSADISFEWTYTVSDVASNANNIDGFIVYVRSSTSSSSYTFGTTPVDETTYYVTREKRAFVLSAGAANRYYNFGVRAYRMVDTDIATPGVVYSPIIQSTGTGENPYRPSANVAFAGDVTGTINSIGVTTITTTVSNFNSNNDRKSTTPATPTSVAFSSATSNINASIDLPLTWTFTGTGDAYDIDGFVIFLRTTTTTNVNNITTSDLNTNIQQVYLTAEKGSHTFSGINPNAYYRAAVRAYRIVDTDIATPGIIYGALANTTERSPTTAVLGGSTGISIGSGKIYIGSGNYNSTDTGFYVDSTGQFSLNNKLVWDGSTLTINGGGTFSGALSAATGTFIGALSGGTISIGSGNNIFKADSNGIYLGDATFASAKFSVSVAGALKATAGSVAGWTIGDVNAPTGSLFTNSLFAGSGSTLALLSPSGFGWFSAGIITTSVNGYLSGVTTNGGALTSMFLRNIQYGGTKPLSGDPNPPKTGDIYFS